MPEIRFVCANTMPVDAEKQQLAPQLYKGKEKLRISIDVKQHRET
jgi:hypothetical protein